MASLQLNTHQTSNIKHQSSICCVSDAGIITPVAFVPLGQSPCYIKVLMPWPIQALQTLHRLHWQLVHIQHLTQSCHKSQPSTDRLRDGAELSMRILKPFEALDQAETQSGHHQSAAIAEARPCCPGVKGVVTLCHLVVHPCDDIISRSCSGAGTCWPGGSSLTPHDIQLRCGAAASSSAQLRACRASLTHVEEVQQLLYGGQCSTQHPTPKGQHRAAAGPPSGLFQCEKGGRQM